MRHQDDPQAAPRLLQGRFGMFRLLVIALVGAILASAVERAYSQTFGVELHNALMPAAGANVEWLRDDLCVIDDAHQSHDVAAQCDTAAYGAWCRALLARGVDPPPSRFEAWFPSLPHPPDHAARPPEAAPAAAAEDKRLCHHPSWGGTYYCKYGYEVETIGGVTYIFVVNINYEVWGRWHSSGQTSEWRSMGGQAWRSNYADLDADETDLAVRTCGAYMAGVLGVPTATYLPYCFFNLLSPILDVLYGYLGFKVGSVERAKDDEITR